MERDVLYQQIDNLVQRLEKSGATRMIDPVEFGEIKGAVDSLKTQMAEVKQRQASIDEKLDLVLGKLSEARGGWRTLMLLGGAASTLGGAVTWLITHTKG